MSLPPKQHARLQIDASLEAAGWIIQERASIAADQNDDLGNVRIIDAWSHNT